MAQRNEEFERGYNLGYDWCRYEGGNTRYAYAELKRRGISPRTAYGVAFVKGAQDAENWVDRRY